MSLPSRTNKICPRKGTHCVTGWWHHHEKYITEVVITIIVTIISIIILKSTVPCILISSFLYEKKAKLVPNPWTQGTYIFQNLPESADQIGDLVLAKIICWKVWQNCTEPGEFRNPTGNLAPCQGHASLVDGNQKSGKTHQLRLVVEIPHHLNRGLGYIPPVVGLGISEPSRKYQQA